MTEQEKREQREAFETAKRELLEAFERAEKADRGEDNAAASDQ